MRLTMLNVALLLALAVGIGLTQLNDRQGQVTEAAVRRYAAAVSSIDLTGAMDEIAPEQRERWQAFVRSQLGNVYEVKSVAVRWPSVVERTLQRLQGQPEEVTVVMDVNRSFPELAYQPTTRARVEMVDGRWYLTEPLLAPVEDR